MTTEETFSRVLVTVVGPDTPGITSALAKVIAGANAHLRDIEQVVVQGRLSLCLLIDLSDEETDGTSLLKDLLFAAKKKGLELHFEVMNPDADRRDESVHHYSVTAVGDEMGARGVHLIADTLARNKANIEKIERLSTDTVSSIRMLVSMKGGEDQAQALRRDLLVVGRESRFDVAVQRESLAHRAKRLIVLDMDSTLIRIEVIDELARAYGVVDRVAAITEEAMSGNMDYEESLRRRVKLLEGMPVAKVRAVTDDLPLTEGAADTIRVLKTLGFKTAVISGGFDLAANVLKERLGLDYAYSNRLEVKDGLLTGNVHAPVVTPQRKADLLDAIAQQEGIRVDQTIAVGDGANDILMLNRAGLGIAFYAKPKLRDAADTSLNSGGLDRILHLLGFRASEVQELLSEL